MKAEELVKELREGTKKKAVDSSDSSDDSDSDDEEKYAEKADQPGVLSLAVACAYSWQVPNSTRRIGRQCEICEFEKCVDGVNRLHAKWALGHCEVPSKP